MFTGIIQGMASVTALQKKPGLHQLTLQLPEHLRSHIALGASIAVDGVCLTVTHEEQGTVQFDMMEETLKKTSLGFLKVGDFVNVERSLRFGDEVGGHLVSGHVHGICKVKEISHSPLHYILSLELPKDWIQYVMPKGFIALHGISLTVVDVLPESSIFTVHLIPETLSRTTLKEKKEGDVLNFEIEQNTLTLVRTVKEYLAHTPLKID